MPRGPLSTAGGPVPAVPTAAGAAPLDQTCRNAWFIPPVKNLPGSFPLLSIVKVPGGLPDRFSI